MENFKIATKLKLRFQTNKGLLSTEQLWELSLDELDELAVSLDAEFKHSAKKSFLYKKSDKDKIAKIKFDVVLDVLNTLKEEEENALNALENKKHNEKINGIISEKMEDSLKNKSVDELKAMLK